MNHSDEDVEEIAYLQKINYDMMDLLHSQLSTIIQFSKRNTIPLDKLYETISIIRKSGHILDHHQPTGNSYKSNRRRNSTISELQDKDESDTIPKNTFRYYELLDKDEKSLLIEIPDITKKLKAEFKFEFPN